MSQELRLPTQNNNDDASCSDSQCTTDDDSSVAAAAISDFLYHGVAPGAQVLAVKLAMFACHLPGTDGRADSGAYCCQEV
jgi:hypothetical protein